MADLFQPFIEKLIDFGFYNFFFPWLITAAIMFGLLRKAKVFGESLSLNGTLSLAISFMIIGFPVILGDPSFFKLPMAAFFTQATVVIMFIAFGLLAASFFYPDLGSFLASTIQHRTILAVMIALGFALFITSGLVNTILRTYTPPKDGGGPPTDVITISAALVVFVIVIIIAVAVVKG